jgi:type III secretion system FlhB-like substrate exporter
MNEKLNRLLAVALAYDEGSREAPRVTAKGEGHVAEKIIALAEDNGITVEANPILAEALAGVALDDTIPVELFEATAEVIGLILKTRHRLTNRP